MSQAVADRLPEEAVSVIASSSAESQSYKRRAPGSVEEKGPTSEPSHKRPRLRPPVKHFLPGYRFSTSDLKRGIEPPSPLFFSNSPQPRPSLPPRFSSSEAAARMLSKARTEDNHVKTVSLARGVVSSAGVNTPPTAGAPVAPSTSTRPSLDRSVTGRSSSPDPHGREMGNVLNSIGVIELLEQDERPTLIVDLADSANYGSGFLRPIFINQSLRSDAVLEALVMGNVSAESLTTGSQSFAEFKSWILSASIDGESLAVCLPSFVFSNVSWTCSTLRKRLRIVSGSLVTTLPDNRGPASRSSLEPNVSKHASRQQEPSDYFGPATLHSDTNTASDGSSAGATTVVPTIEQSASSTAAQSILTPDTRMSDVLLPPHTDLSEATELLPYASTYVDNPPKRAPESSRSSSVDRASSHIPVVEADSPSFDWTRLPITDSMPAHIQFARSIDWASTSLGPIEAWSSDLRQMCNLIMASPHPAAM